MHHWSDIIDFKEMPQSPAKNCCQDNSLCFYNLAQFQKKTLIMNSEKLMLNRVLIGLNEIDICRNLLTLENKNKFLLSVIRHQYWQKRPNSTDNSTTLNILNRLISFQSKLVLNPRCMVFSKSEILSKPNHL